MAAAAVTPLCVFGLHGVARAQTDTISSTATTEQYTATAVNGGPGNIDVASGGAVNPDGGTAILMNSNNSVSVEGAITIKNANNSVGIQALNGTQGSITVTGSITETESYTPATNADGYTQEPYASGSGRYGIQTQGSFIGNVTMNGSISVQGNNSYGVYIANGLGNLSNVGTLTLGAVGTAGSISVTGDNSAGVYTAGAIYGSVQIIDSVSAKGQNSNAVQITGNVNGSLTVYSTLSATAYASTTRPTTSTLLSKVEAVPAQVEQGGSALIVGGSVTGGIFLGAPPSGTATGSTADVDGDGIADGSEGTSSLVTYGSSPALVIGQNTSPITIGEFGACNASSSGPGDNCFGLIVEGTISGNGIYDGVSATAVDIGQGGAGVTFAGGVRIAPTSTISATSYEANATGILIEPNVTIPLLQNEGTIEASVTSTGATSANAILIDAWTSSTPLPSTLTNYGTINATSTGTAGSSYAVVDHSGSISTVNNYGTIEATIATQSLGATATGSTVAIDLSANTTGVRLYQAVFGTGASPVITGDVLLGSGTNSVDLEAGSITGQLSMGSGATESASNTSNGVGGSSGSSISSLTIDGGAYVHGAVTYGGSSINISVNDGQLLNTAPTIITGTNLTVGSASTVSFALDPGRVYVAPTGAASNAQYTTNTTYNMSKVTLDSGATLGVTFLSVPTSIETFTVIKAGALSAGATNFSVTTPFLFSATSQSNQAAGTVTVTVAPRSATALGLNKAETAALPAIYASLGQDSGILSALANAPTSSSFHQSYQQMLPDSAGDVFQVVTSMSKAVARASVGAAGFDGSGSVGVHANADEADDEEDEIAAPGGLWASEYIIGLNQSRQDNEAYRAVGLGLVAGLDLGGLGADVSFGSANVVKPHDPGDSNVSISRVEAGLYATPQFGILHTEARVAGGYLKISDRREFAADVLEGTDSAVTGISRTANSSWNGYDLSARLGASAPFDITNHFFLTPQAHVDVFDVSENAHSESGGGSGFDLNVNARSSSESSVTASVIAGLRYGSSFVFKPQIELGWDDVVTGGPANTTARFAYGGSSFTLAPDSVSGGAGVARIRLDGDGQFVHFSLEAGGEFRSDYQNADIKAVFRISY
jgi:hypothetical protein